MLDENAADGLRGGSTTLLPDQGIAEAAGFVVLMAGPGTTAVTSDKETAMAHNSGSRREEYIRCLLKFLVGSLGYHTQLPTTLGSVVSDAELIAGV